MNVLHRNRKHSLRALIIKSILKELRIIVLCTLLSVEKVNDDDDYQYRSQKQVYDKAYQSTLILLIFDLVAAHYCLKDNI